MDEWMASCGHLPTTGYKTSAYTCCHVLMRGGACWHLLSHVFLRTSFSEHIYENP